MIINGKKIAEEILAELAEEVKKMSKPPRLAAVLVGTNEGSRKFLELKKLAAERIGIECRIYEFPEGITTQKLRKEIVGIARAGVNHGVIIELPLPVHINTQYILNAVSEEKDADALSEGSQGSFFAGRAKILPPAVEAVKIILEKNIIELKGKSCAVFGYGLLVGKPISHWLAQQGVTVSIINEFTTAPKFYTLNADIIISGVGKPNLIKADMIKDGAVIIDFGYNSLNGKIVGDVDFEEMSKRVSFITPVPGGVGPLVVAAVLKNLLTLYKK